MRGFSFMRCVVPAITGLLFFSSFVHAQPRGGARPRPPILPNWTAEQTFESLDANKDKKLTWTEFKAFRGIPKGKQGGILHAPANEKELREKFKNLDANTDNVITLDELQTLDKESKNEKKDKKDKN